MAFDRKRRVSALAALRRRQIVEEASWTPTERLQLAEELLAMAWSMHGRPAEEPWSALAARRERRGR